MENNSSKDSLVKEIGSALAANEETDKEEGEIIDEGATTDTGHSILR